MQIFLVYQRGEGIEAKREFVKKGPSILAGIFNIFWAAYHSLWKLLFITLVLGTFIHYLDNDNLNNMWNFILFLGFTIFAQELREYSLKSKQYIMTDIIAASNQEEAELIYLNRITKTYK